MRKYTRKQYSDIYFEVVLVRGKVKLPKITVDMEGINSKDANNKILDMYQGDLKVDSTAMIGNRLS
jgi:hypothetical protein